MKPNLTVIVESELALVAPTARRARSAAAAVERLPHGPNARRILPLSLAGFLSRGEDLPPAVFCPEGRTLVRDLAFLRQIRDRLLWPGPDPILYGAISGVLAHLPERPAAKLLGSAGGRTALLLEGPVGWERARLCLRSEARLWIVESVGRVRLSARRLEELRKKGVHWAVLRPVSVVALAATPLLARSRSRWKNLLPSRTPVWVLPRGT